MFRISTACPPRTRADGEVTAPLPDALHELIEYETACAYADGWRAALEAVAAGQVELDETWRPVGRRGYAQRVAERLALFEQCAAKLAQQIGRREWRDLPTRRPGTPAFTEGQRAA